jgi:hypothetical protein
MFFLFSLFFFVYVFMAWQVEVQKMLWIGGHHCPETVFLDCFGAQGFDYKESIPPAYLI